MDNKQRIDLVGSVVSSLSDSIGKYEDSKKEHGYARPGYNIGIENSRSSIVRRCRVAREELLNIMKDLES